MSVRFAARTRDADSRVGEGIFTLAMISTSSPGAICYRDEFQVAAIPRAQLARFLG